jgi:putative transport protein
VVDRSSYIADVAFIGAAIAIGALVGAFVYKVGDVPLTLSTAGGALISGLSFGWLLSAHRTFSCGEQCLLLWGMVLVLLMS